MLSPNTSKSQRSKIVDPVVDCHANQHAERKMLDLTLMKRLWPYIRHHYMLLGLSIFFMLSMNASSILHPYLIKIGIDRHVSRGNLQGLYHICLLLAIVLASNFVFFTAFNYSVNYLGQRLLFDIRLDLFQKVLALSNNYFDSTSVGQTLSNVTNDVEAIRQFISEGIVNVAGDLLKMCFILIAMLLVNARLALLSFTVIPFFLAATAIFRKSIRSGYRGVRKANSDINTSLVETINGIQEIHLFNHEKRSQIDFESYNRNYLDAFLEVVHSYSLYFPIIEIVANGSMIIIFLYIHFAIGSKFEIGVIFAFFSYISMLFKPLRQMAEKFNMFQSAMAASERVFTLLDEDIAIRHSEQALCPDRPMRGEIRFDNVTFAYTPGTPVIKNLSFTIRPGEKVAIVGHTGSGKTTTISLLNRLYDIQEGTITIDGVNIKDYELRYLRTQIATVPQDVFLFTGSVADNITLHDPQIQRQAVELAARQVYADRYIEKLPNRYDEHILEEGKLLSVGQRQLLSFARAFVRKPSIVVLDEATSNIDSETEALIEAGVKNLLKGKTAIIIAHRLSTIKSVDHILVLHKGELAEEGRHDSLLQAGGLYKQLYDMQALMLGA
ncbi:antibiotic ABC transporter ATP-binding protein [candidate division KSB3 bacterium]|uniref:Antibiotic ABC transporter ATP-binding protein n=1 Tax=candidate division KSB3 bacterium TaxID=2044937 RepID=A0A2G6E9B0_9BACT|nr:MAG: antibiotic ABC transporter ATP-binding protein [candidate division KSB3 bacterium]PIE29593.1 MAG: antibiotic ABC transporter ATP-binding protein [candidate division KSB3 bacterium]